MSGLSAGLEALGLQRSAHQSRQAQPLGLRQPLQLLPFTHTNPKVEQGTTGLRGSVCCCCRHGGKTTSGKSKGGGGVCNTPCTPAPVPIAHGHCQLVPMMRRDANGGSATNQGHNLQHTKPQMTPPAVAMLSGQRGSWLGVKVRTFPTGPPAGDNRNSQWLPVASQA